MNLKQQVAEELSNLYAEHGEVDTEYDCLVLPQELQEQAAFLHDSYVDAVISELTAAVAAAIKPKNEEIGAWLTAKEESVSN